VLGALAEVGGAASAGGGLAGAVAREVSMGVLAGGASCEAPHARASNAPAVSPQRDALRSINAGGMVGPGLIRVNASRPLTAILQEVLAKLPGVIGVALLLAAACGAGEDSSPATGTGGSTALSCELGSMYPNQGVIDPDAPVFEDANWDQAKVSDAFAKAKADGTTAYLAYRAARDYTQHLDCAFCACGCAPGIGHRSAIDCFKDMHGFT
jgi:hypothetical protein